LAPQLAPRNPATVHPGAPKCGPPRVAPQLRLGSCDTWATKLVTIRGPRRQPPAGTGPTFSTAAPGPPSALPVPAVPWLLKHGLYRQRILPPDRPI
jgi:hypothetical protein